MPNTLFDKLVELRGIEPLSCECHSHVLPLYDSPESEGSALQLDVPRTQARTFQNIYRLLLSLA